jgi:hypothetical protein
MSADDVAVLVAAIAASVAAVGSLVAVVILGRRIRELRQLVGDLGRETVPLVREARVVVDQAATEMMRVGDGLGSAESVSATVDSASRLAYRAFANPVVKVLAFGTGTGAALRRLVGGKSPEPSVPRLQTTDRTRPDDSSSASKISEQRRHRQRRVRR